MKEVCEMAAADDPEQSNRGEVGGSDDQSRDQTMSLSEDNMRCGRCRARPTTGSHKGDRVLKCPDCGQILFRQTKPTITNDD